MKIRGSLKINKELHLANPGGLPAAEGLIAVSDAEGKVRWGRYSIPDLSTNTFYEKKGTLVSHLDKVYYSLVQDADGAHYEDLTVWKELTGSVTEPLAQDIIDALNGSNDPSAGNVFATLKDVNNLLIKGTSTLASILLKSSTVANILWISSTDGVDSLGENVYAGDGLVSTGSGWKSIGAIRGPRGLSSTETPSTAQDNTVRVLTIQVSNLSGTGTMEQQICDYILALPEEQRTISETDSKWNVVVNIPVAGINFQISMANDIDLCNNNNPGYLTQTVYSGGSQGVPELGDILYTNIERTNLLPTGTYFRQDNNLNIVDGVVTYFYCEPSIILA